MSVIIPECSCCDGSGWVMCMDAGGEGGYWIACPEGCPQTGPASPASSLDDQEVPY